MKKIGKVHLSKWLWPCFMTIIQFLKNKQISERLDIGKKKRGRSGEKCEKLKRSLEGNIKAVPNELCSRLRVTIKSFFEKDDELNCSFRGEYSTKNETRGERSEREKKPKKEEIDFRPVDFHVERVWNTPTLDALQTEYMTNCMLRLDLQ